LIINHQVQMVERLATIRGMVRIVLIPLACVLTACPSGIPPVQRPDAAPAASVDAGGICDGNAPAGDAQDGQNDGQNTDANASDQAVTSVDGSLCPGGCDDNDPCTTDTCVGGTCVNKPINCDDNDPCTADSCKGGSCEYEKTGQTIYRYFNVGTGAFAYGTGTTGPSGFSTQGPLFRALPGGATGGSVVYQQYRVADGDFMLTQNLADGACCGYVNVGNVGYVPKTSQGTSITIFRFVHPTYGTHLSSTSSSEGLAFGFVLEPVVFHACPL
jgi:hypothetical protein